MAMIKVLVADDHPVIRDGFQMILSTDPEVEVLATAKDGAEAVALVSVHRPHVVLMDMYMPEKNGLEALKEIKLSYPLTKVLILSSMINDDLVIDCLSAGANGILLKDWPTEKIIYAMKQSVADQLVIPESYSAKLVEIWKQNTVGERQNDNGEELIRELGLSLKTREEDVFLQLIEGKRNDEIAQDLYLSVGTVKNYISSLYKKLGVTNRSELLQYVDRKKDQLN